MSMSGPGGPRSSKTEPARSATIASRADHHLHLLRPDRRQPGLVEGHAGALPAAGLEMDDRSHPQGEDPIGGTGAPPSQAADDDGRVRRLRSHLRHRPVLDSAALREMSEITIVIDFY